MMLNRTAEWRYHRPLRITLLLLPLLSAVNGCRNLAADQVRAQLSEVNSQEEVARQTLANQQSSLATMSQRLRAQKAGMEEYNTRIEGYILDHKMAVAVIAAGVGGSATALSQDNAYSSNVKQIGGLVAVLAVLWAANNMDEVSDVVKNLNYADAHVKSLKVNIDEITSAILQQQTDIEACENKLAILGQRKSALQTQLSQL